MEVTLTQNQDTWLEARKYRFTASEIHKLMSSSRSGGGLSQTAESYVYEKASEILTGISKPIYGDALEWGKSYEKEAFEKFSMTTFEKFEYYGGENYLFIPYGEYSGCSPDGLSENAVLEIKAPYNSSIHLKNLTIHDADSLKQIHKDYYYQTQMCMLATGLEKAYFVSYDPRMPMDKQLHIAEIEKHDLEFEFNERLELANELMQNILK